MHNSHINSPAGTQAALKDDIHHFENNPDDCYRLRGNHTDEARKPPDRVAVLVRRYWNGRFLHVFIADWSLVLQDHDQQDLSKLWQDAEEAYPDLKDLSDAIKLFHGWADTVLQLG